MDKNSLTEHQILRDLARIQLMEFDPSEEETYEDAEEEKMENGSNQQMPWKVPSRKVRDLILADELLRFASTTDRPCTSQTHTMGPIDPGSTSETCKCPDTDPPTCPWVIKNARQKKENDLKNPEPEVEKKETSAAASSKTPKTMNIAAEAGISGSEPPQSASFKLSQPLVSSVQDAYTPVGQGEEAKIPIDPQPDTNPHHLPASRPDAIPVTNRILAAIAQNELERSSSSSSSQQPIIPDETKDCLVRNDAQLFGFFLENLKAFHESDLSRSSSSDSLAPANQSPSERSDELSALNQHLLLTTELEDMISKNMKVIVSSMLKHKSELQSLKKELNTKLAMLQSERVEAGAEGDKDCTHDPQANQREEPKEVNDEVNAIQQEGILAAHADNTCNQPVAENLNENDFQRNDHNAAEAVHDPDANDAGQLEFPEEDDLSGLEWTRPEKRRLGTVIRDLSREMKTKELQQKKAKLLKKGRVIAQAIENKIYDINKEITAVNKKSLRHVALPLDKIQEYDWVRVASVLNAKRSPEECRTYWKCFLHPTINGNEWSLVEVKAMELIAQRHNFRNWDDIAEELNTGRSGYQCYTFYRKHLCPHSELRGNQK